MIGWIRKIDPGHRCLYETSQALSLQILDCEQVYILNSSKKVDVYETFVNSNLVLIAPVSLEN